MQIVRIIAATVILGYLSWHLTETVIAGIRTGTIRHNGGFGKCRRKENAIGFWSLVLLFSGFVAIFIFSWIWVVLDAVKQIR